MKFKEVEFKYKAENVALADFNALCEKLAPLKSVITSGYDHFYSPKAGDNFCRHRVGIDINQLTFKSKTTDKNNFIRTEHNLDLLPFVKKDQVAALCGEFGYFYNSTIFKTVFVHKYPLYSLVYYICYDTNMKELGRFVEAEMEEAHDWGSEDNAWHALRALEEGLKPLGITPQNRMKLSLYEMFKK